MKSSMIAMVAIGVSMLAGCQENTVRREGVNREAVIGAGAGAILGAVVTPEAPLTGGVVGAVIGGLAGQLIGNSNRPGYCRYRDINGSTYERLCPPERTLIGHVAGRRGFCTFMNSRGQTFVAPCGRI